MPLAEVDGGPNDLDDIEMQQTAIERIMCKVEISIVPSAFNLWLNPA